METNAASLREAFDQAEPYTVGIEDELLLLDPRSFELAPCAPQLLARVEGDPRFKLELPASQLEIVTPPFARVTDLGAFLARARADLDLAADGLVRLASAGVHPSSGGEGELNELGRYEDTIREFGLLAKRELVCALQVHVAVGSSERALDVYNATRSYLPLLAALAANAPFYEGRDTGLASVRPKICDLLPRQGVPPALESWEQYAGALAWGSRAGAFDARTWWWELRPHCSWGTLEFRVPDGQTTATDAIAIAGVIQALVAWLDQRCASGERPAIVSSWQIEENRWSACRYGTKGSMVDYATGERRTTSELLSELLLELAPLAESLHAGGALQRAADMIGAGGAAAQRGVVQRGGVGALTRWLAKRFCEPVSG